MAQKTTAKKPLADDPRYTQALQSYEAGLRAMQEHKFDKAKPHFQKVVGSSIKELTDRASLHLNTCNQHIERSSANQFKTTEEHFEALRLNPQLRYQARNDSDFQNLAEDPRFTELLYPDPGAPEDDFREEEPA